MQIQKILNLQPFLKWGPYADMYAPRETFEIIKTFGTEPKTHPIMSDERF